MKGEASVSQPLSLPQVSNEAHVATNLGLCFKKKKAPRSRPAQPSTLNPRTRAAHMCKIFCGPARADVSPGGAADEPDGSAAAI